MKAINVLSLFDGMSCGQIALDRVGVPVANYYASEIDTHTMKVTQHNFPRTQQLGDINNWQSWSLNWSSIDLIMGGSPCQGFSFAGKQLAFEDPRSKLFFIFVDILTHVRKYRPDVRFFLENVKMKKDYLAVITQYMGVEPLFVNSALVSAQNRQRYYWTNLGDGTLPEDKHIYLADILEDLPDCPVGVQVRKKSRAALASGRYNVFDDRHTWDSPFQRVSKSGKLKNGILKAACLTGGANSGGNHSDMDILHTPYATRRYSVTECERLQTVPEGYTAGVSNTQRFRMLGNGWTVDVVAHFLRQHYMRLRDCDLEGILGNDMNAAAIRGRYVNKGTIVGRRLNEEGKRQDYDKRIALTQCLEVRKTNRDKSNCLTTVEKDNVLTRLEPGRYEDAFARKEDWRYYSLTECCRLQTVPEDYFGDIVSESQAKKILGNGWTVDVAAHFFNDLRTPLVLSLDFTK